MILLQNPIPTVDLGTDTSGIGAAGLLFMLVAAVVIWVITK